MSDYSLSGDGGYRLELNWSWDAQRNMPGGRDVWIASGSKLGSMIMIEVEGPWSDRTWSYKVMAADTNEVLYSGAGRDRAEAEYNAEKSTSSLGLL